MNQEKIRQSMVHARIFLHRAEVFLKTQEDSEKEFLFPSPSPVESGALRRASMELTRSLARMRGEMMNLHDIEKEVVAWHRETFPNATMQAITAKFDEEIHEMADEIVADDGDNIFCDAAAAEFADMCIVYMAGLDRLGKPSLSSLIAAKLAVNKGREWGPETPSGDRPRVK